MPQNKTDQRSPPDNRRVRIFDTTLRDGEQAPGFSMDVSAKLRVAKALAALRVDVIEAGFAAASPGDREAVETVAGAVDGPTICTLARAIREDIAIAAQALVPAARKRIHVFISTSPLHRAAKLGMDRSEVLARIRDAVAFARDHVEDVEFSAEDAIRTERDFLVECLAAAAEAGASTLNVPDTVGYTTPGEIEALFAHLSVALPLGDRIILSAHCHDDLGLALANSLAALKGGARQVECTLNGIGERAGNCALEELVMALRTRAELFGLTTGIDTRQLMAASLTLADATGIAPSPNKAIVGANAFAHEAGIHQHGVLRDRATYEIMRPEDVGASADGIILGKHSGRHALAMRARRLGAPIEGARLGEVFAAFKTLADRVGLVGDRELLALLTSTTARAPAPSISTCSEGSIR